MWKYTRNKSFEQTWSCLVGLVSRELSKKQDRRLTNAYIAAYQKKSKAIYDVTDAALTT